MTLPITVIIPTFNEEINLPSALESIKGWAEQIIVVDSYSTDNTVDIAISYGAEVYQHPYENMAAQRMWGLQISNIRHEWIFNLDGDERLTPDIKTEIESVLHNVSDDVAGFRIRRRHIFMGRWMKHGGDYIWLIRLVRRGRCRVIKTPIVNEHTIINGKVGSLHSDFIHEPKKSLTDWMQRVNKGAQKFALGIYNQPNNIDYPKVVSDERIEGSIRTFLNYNFYVKMPLFLRPFIRFFVLYLLRGGFLDGWQGFIYHTINDFFYPFLVWAKCREFSLTARVKEEAEGAKWR